MRTKILAMCMTMVMLIAGTGIVIAGDQSVDADSVPTSAITDVGTVNLYQKQGAQTLVDIYLNEYAFSGYNVTVDWYVYCSTDSTIDGSGFGDVVRKDKNTARPSWATTNQTAATTNNSKPYEQDTGKEFTIGISELKGKSVRTITVTNNCENGTNFDSFYCNIKVTITATIGTEDVPVDSYYYQMQVIGTNVSPVAPSTIQIWDGSDFGNSLTCYVAKVVEGAEMKLTCEMTDPSNITQLRWYATDLPKGLAITENGYLVGVPLEAVNNRTIDVYVSVTEKNTSDEIVNQDILKGTISITVLDGTGNDGSTTIELKVAGVSGANVVGSASPYIVVPQIGGVPVIKLEAKITSEGSNGNSNGYIESAKIIDSEGRIVTYNLPGDQKLSYWTEYVNALGVGSYTVIVEYHAHESGSPVTKTETCNIIVMPVQAGIKAAIALSGGN